jgi:hypothetical protein
MRIGEKARKIGRGKRADTWLAILLGCAPSHPREFIVHVKRLGRGAMGMRREALLRREGDRDRYDVEYVAERGREAGKIAGTEEGTQVGAECGCVGSQGHLHPICGNVKTARRVDPVRYTEIISRPLKLVVTGGIVVSNGDCFEKLQATLIQSAALL